jgi:hypothetical protein
MLGFEVAMISKLTKEMGIGATDEELNEIKQWEEILSSPMKQGPDQGASDFEE